MSKAVLRGVRLSPKKARLIARQVQGMNAEYALASLEFTPNKAAKVIYKVLASAIANGDYQPEEVFISSCRIDEGAVLKRFIPRARGTASKIRKPTAHITIIIDEVKSDKQIEKKIPEKKADINAQKEQNNEKTEIINKKEEQ